MILDFFWTKRTNKVLIQMTLVVIVHNTESLKNEPHREKICFRRFRRGQRQTGLLYSQRRQLEA